MSDDAMNGYGLTASIIQSIASLGWPISFAVAAYAFRKPLEKLLPRLYVKHSDWEASFRLDTAEKEAESLPTIPTAQNGIGPTPEELSRFEQLARIAPKAAIMEARSELELALNAAAELFLESETKRPLGVLNSIRVLRKANVLEPHISAILDDLRNLGNAAAHTRTDFSISDAMRYRKLTDDALAQLNSILIANDVDPANVYTNRS